MCPLSSLLNVPVPHQPPAASRHPINWSFLKIQLRTQPLSSAIPLSPVTAASLYNDTWLPVCFLIVQRLDSSVQRESLGFTPGPHTGLFVCWGQSVASQSLMELKRCLGLIILEVSLKVTVPQMLFAGGKGRREAYIRNLRILALFCVCVCGTYKRDKVSDIPLQLNLNQGRNRSLETSVPAIGAMYTNTLVRLYFSRPLPPRFS